MRVNKVLPNKLRGSMESITDKCWICSFCVALSCSSGPFNMLQNQFFQIENAKIASLLIHCQRSNYSLRTVDSVNMFINKQTNNSQVVNVFTDRNVLELNRGQIILLLQTRLLKTVFMNTICRQFCIAILLLQEHYCKKHYCKNTTAHNITTKSIFLGVDPWQGF